MIENMLKAEIEEFVENNNASKNGYYPKRVRSDSGELELNIPRDRNSEFEPQIVKKGQRNISGMYDNTKQINNVYISLSSINLFPFTLICLMGNSIVNEI